MRTIEDFRHVLMINDDHPRFLKDCRTKPEGIEELRRFAKIIEEYTENHKRYDENY